MSSGRYSGVSIEFNELKSSNISAKLKLRWSKPMVITKIVRPNVVLLAHPDTGVIIRRVHVSQLKKYVL